MAAASTATMMRSNQPPSTSLDDSILTYIRCMQCSSSKSSPDEHQQQSISKKQIQNFFTDDYDTTTTKKDVKQSLKRLVKRNCIAKDGKGYSYVQPHQISIDSSTSSDEGYHNQKVDVQSSLSVATGGSIERTRTVDRDIEQPSLDDNILSYIRDFCQSSSSAASVLQKQSISKEQIQKYYDRIVDDYDTTKKDVKHSLKWLIKRRAIVKDGQKKYSYIQTQQNRDICTVITTNRTNKRKRQSESSDDVFASTIEPTTCMKRISKCSVDGCKSFSRTGYGGVCLKHGAKKYKCSHEGCDNHAKESGFCIKHGAKVKLCGHEGCKNQAIGGFKVCYRHGAIRKRRKKCEREGCDKYTQRLGVCWSHGGSA